MIKLSHLRSPLAITIRDSVIFLIFILCGIFYINFIWNDKKEEQTTQALQIARSVKASLSIESIQNLAANPDDTSKVSYKLIKEKLHNVVQVNPLTKFAYLYIMRDGKLLFMVDSEPTNSPDLSPPGQEFSEAEATDFKPFETGEAQTTDPVTDRWGTWVSAEVPIKNTDNSEVIAVLGIDYDASSWKRSILATTFKSGFLVLITLILIIVIRIGRIRNNILKLEIQNKKIAQNKLDERETQLSSLVINLPGIVYRCTNDEDYPINFISDSCTRITGYTPDQYTTKKSISLNQIILPEFHERTIKNWLDNIQRNRVFEDEYPIKTASGEIKWLWERAKGVYSDKGELLYLEGYIEDITGKKKNEAELIKAKEKAEESDRLKSLFLANISHEIRTPMNGILGFAELLKEPDLSAENQQEFLGVIEKSGQRMLNIINDLIDISKIEAGETIIRIRKTDLNKMLKEIHLFFIPEANFKTIQIDYHCGLPDESCNIETDSTKLSQILINLLKNAVKFTKEGSIHFGYKQIGSMIEFYVSDTGPGIPPEQTEQIFERFKQSTLNLTRNYEGAGLGLSISKAYVEMLGGSIRVESELGKGSIFLFELPLKNQQN